MKSEDVYFENLKLFCKRSPSLLESVENVNCDRLEFSATKKGERNLKTRHGDKFYYFHSNYSAESEAEKWANSLDLQDEGVLYVFGIGLGYYYDGIVGWLRGGKERYLVFLEDDLAVLRRFLETNRARAILEDSQVVIHYQTEALEGSESLANLCWSFVSLPRKVSVLNYYQQMRLEYFSRLHFELSSEGAFQDTLALELNSSGDVFFKNFYSNTLLLQDSYHGNKLFGKFQGIPAVICGAGPSLNKNVQQLQGLRDKALVLSGGSALNVLDDLEILPHFGAGLDPHEWVIERMKFKNCDDLPFFYHSRIDHKSLKSVKGPRLYVSGPSFYPVTNWVERELGIKGDKIEGGYSVLNLCMEIACFLGCNPIILTGMDLAYTEGLIYAEGVKDIAVEGKEVNLKDPNALLRKDIYGKPVYTHWKWVREAQWISEFSRQNPQVTFINATEGGLGFDNIQNLTLQEVARTDLVKKHNVEGFIRKELGECFFHDITSDKITSVLNRLMGSLDRCMIFFDKSLNALDEKTRNLLEGRPVKGGLECDMVEMRDEIAFQMLIQELSKVLEQKLTRKIYQIENDSGLASHQEKELSILEIEKERFYFYKKVTADNIYNLKSSVSVS
ncbi:MAG: hypothetical protein ACI8RA_000926 [Chlamydiales bacterium]|jgi:hypothetical protein